MARTKLTARKSTGGWAPRHQLAPRRSRHKSKFLGEFGMPTLLWRVLSSMGYPEGREPRYYWNKSSLVTVPWWGLRQWSLPVEETPPGVAGCMSPELPRLSRVPAKWQYSYECYVHHDEDQWGSIALFGTLVQFSSDSLGWEASATVWVWQWGWEAAGRVGPCDSGEGPGSPKE